MARFGVICEYNPLHEGHVFHINSARAHGADEIVCIMSGNFVQRGEPAIAHKYTRAQIALECGADLVIELPFPYAAAGAEFFAAAGVCASDALGADTLFFGSECGDIDRLAKAAEVVCSPAFSRAYQALIKTNVGTAAAYAKAFEDIAKSPCPTLSNDILGLAYCKAILQGGYDLKPSCILRQGSAFRDDRISDTYPSATALRKLQAKQGFAVMAAHLPTACKATLEAAHAKGELLSNAGAYDTAILALLRTAGITQIEKSAFCAGGLGARIAEPAQKATDLSQLYALCAHKALPHAHVQRAVLYAALGITQADLQRTPSYFSVLAANEKGRKILAELRRTCPVPLITKPADAPDCPQRTLTDRADALYTLAMQSPQNAAFFTRQSPVITD